MLASLHLDLMRAILELGGGLVAPSVSFWSRPTRGLSVFFLRMDFTVILVVAPVAFGAASVANLGDGVSALV